MRAQLLAPISIMVLSAACQAPLDQNAPRYGAPGAYSSSNLTSEQACASYGFAIGSAAFNRCVTSERAVRSSGPVSRNYSEAQMNADARNACSSYGLQPASASFDRCVSREVEARRYRQAAAQPAYPTYSTDQYGNRVDSEGYRVDANGYRLAPQPSYVAPSPPATTGQQVFRDEFGFRYDAQGNRVDRNGNIISPQSTTP